MTTAHASNSPASVPAWRALLKDIFFLTAGVAMASVGLKCFLLPNDILDGGATGVSLLTELLTGVDLSYVLLLVNIPFVVLGSRLISGGFAVRSACAIVALAVTVHYASFPTVTNDKLLIAVFGGFFLGTGIGLAIRGGGVIDGAEVLAVSISKRSSLTVGDVITIFNVVLFSVATILVNIETAMYSMLTYFAASKSVDFIIQGIEEYTGVIIVSAHSRNLKQHITDVLGRGVTVYKAEKGYGSRGDFTDESARVLFCVVTRLEVTKLLHEIDRIDPDAFVVQHTIKDTKGGMIKKRPLH
ncbi:MAG: YitT family protein [Candidatus Kapaibacterium sp.]|jgi:uncharacterized membrane-anchored protein YitT (DUF2179 family)